MILRSSGLLALGVALAACGGSGPDRFALTTPGAHTGVGPIVTLAPPTPTATATPAAKPKAAAKKQKVTQEEKRVIRAWSEQLRHGHVAAASRYFAVPSFFRNVSSSGTLKTRAQVKDFNATLPCGAKLLSTRRGVSHLVIGTFRLTERPGGACGAGAGSLAAVGFLVKSHHIARWLRQDDPAAPTATPTPDAAPTATPDESVTSG
jgi:hypothetical protein